MTSFSCPPVYVKRAIVDIEEQMRKSLAHFLNSLHVEVVQNIKINQEKFDRQHFIFFPHFLKPAIPMSVCSKVLDCSYFCCVSNFPSSVHLFCEKFNGALLRTLFSHCPWTLPPSRRRRCQTFWELLKKSVSVFILGSYKRIVKSKSLNRAPVKARHKNRKTIDLIVCRDC